MATTTNFTAKDVQELRQRTGAGMMDCKKALTDSSGDMERAAELLRAKGAAKADKRAGRETREGYIGHYVHHNGKVGALVEVNCETDFVARNADFRELVREIAMQVASTAPLAVDRDGIPVDVVDRERRIAEQQVAESGKPEHIRGKIVEGKVDAFFKDNTLLSQPWIRDGKKTIADLVKEASAKVGENIVVRRFARFEIGRE